MMALLTGGMGKWIAYALAAIALAGAIAVAVHQHDSRIREAAMAADRVAADAAVAAAERADHARVVAALNDQLAEASSRTASFDRIKETIHATPPSKACIDPGPIASALDGLRNRPAAGRGSPQAAATGSAHKLP